MRKIKNMIQKSIYSQRALSFPTLLLVLTLTSTVIHAREIKNDKKRIYVKEQIRLADGLKQRGFLTEAIQEYARLIRKFPNDPVVAEAWVHLAETYAAKKDFPAALSTFEACFKKFPDIRIIPAAKFKYAMVLNSSKTPAIKTKAITILNALVADTKTPPTVQTAANYHLALMFIAAGDHAKGEKILISMANTTISGKPEDSYIVAAGLELTNILKKKGDIQGAAKLLEPLASANFAGKTNGPRLYWTLGTLQSELGRDQESAATFAKFALLFPKSPSIKSALYNRLSALHKSSEYSKVIAETEKLEKSGKIGGKGWERFACVKAASLKMLKFHKASLELWRKILAETKETKYFRYAAVNLISALIASGNPAAAIVETEKLLDDKRLTDENIADIAKIAVSATDKKSALQILRKAHARITSNTLLGAQSALNLAAALRRVEKEKEAIGIYSKLLDTSTHAQLKPYALLGMANALKTIGETSQGEESLREILKSYPKTPLRPNALFNLATLMVNDRKRWSEASEKFKEITTKYPGTVFKSNSLFYQGYILFYEKKFDEAIAMLKLLDKAKPPLTGQLAINATAYKIWAYLKIGDSASALKVYANIADKRKLIKSSPLAFLCDLAMTLPITEQNNAELCFNRAITESKIATLRQTAILGLSKTQINSGDTVKAMESLKKAVELDADPYITSAARLALGKILVERGSGDKAVLVLEKCLENPVDAKSSAAARLELAKALSTNPKRLKTARRYAMAVYVLSNDKEICSEGMLFSIKLSLKLKKFKEATAIWQEFATRFPEEAKSKKAQRLHEQLTTIH